VRAERSDQWRLVLNAKGSREVVTARALVNAGGPWVDEVTELTLRRAGPSRARLVKGSHIVVPKLFDHDSAYIFQNPDGRIVFAIPYETDFTLIGTTDEDFKGELNSVAASVEEIQYLCDAVIRYFRQPLSPDDVVWSYAGVRALYDDHSSKPEDATRDYHLALDRNFGEAPLLTVYGGKITTYRRLAESALQLLSPFFAMRGAWTAHDPLPGGDFAWDAINDVATDMREQWPFLDAAFAKRLVHAYGTRAKDILGAAKSFEDLGECFGEDLTAAEVRYLMDREWALEASDILWRRTKLGLRFTDDERARLTSFMAQPRGLNAAE
jgi:glycerol-3-phosphate dehydrogenase